MRSWTTGFISATAIIAAPLAAEATSLQVSPVKVEVPAPGAASLMTLTNTGSEVLNAQVRVFKWIQVNGQDELVPTRDVVASPPAMKIGAGKKGVVRIVRVGKSPVVGEETYRLKIDEVPSRSRAGQTAVSFAVSYSVPVFFTKFKQGPLLSWKATIVKGQIRLEADNAGDRHARLADLKISNAKKSKSVAPGLAGYVLGQSAKSWIVKNGAKFATVGDTIKITAQGEAGPIESTAHVVAAN
jgi:fimbrial chaperone protein